MKTTTKNSGIAFKVAARLQGKPNKAGEMPLIVRFTFTKDGKTTQAVKSLKQNVAPADFDDKAGLLKSNAPGANTVNALIASRCHLLRTAATSASDPTNWNEVAVLYEELVATSDADAKLLRVQKKIANVQPVFDLEDAVKEKHRIDKEKKRNAETLAALAAKGYNAQQEEIDFFVKHLDEYADTFIKSSQLVKNQITSWVNNLKRFSEETNTPLTFANMTKAFYKAYGDWIFGEGNYDAWFGACVKRLKTFLNKAVVEGIAVNPAYQSFEVLTERKEVIYLTTAELDLVWNYAGADKWRKYQDLCVFGNLTGLRVSDIMNSKFRVEDGMLIGRNKKNKSDYYVPLATDDRIEMLVNAYGFNMAIVSEQKYNKYIKVLLGEIFTKHNINQKPIDIINYRWRQPFYSEHLKQDLITNHSSRRGFVTNMYNVHKFEVEDIKSMIGSTSNEILKYLKVEQSSVKEKAEGKRLERIEAMKAKAKELVH